MLNSTEARDDSVTIRGRRSHLEDSDLYLHHEDHRVESDHDEHRVLEGGRRHEVPQPVLEGLSVLGHVARHGFGADGKVDASPLVGRKRGW